MKGQLLENAAALFGAETMASDGKERIRELHAKIGELTVERDFHMVSSLSTGMPTLLVSNTLADLLTNK